MVQKVDPNKILELAAGKKRLYLRLEEQTLGVQRDIRRLAQNAANAYPESDRVRNAAQKVEESLQEISSFASIIFEMLRNKERALISVAHQYREIEYKARSLSNQKYSKFKISTYPLTFVGQIQQALLKLKDAVLKEQLKDLKEDPKIKSLLEAMNSGTIEDKAQARLELQLIADAFKEIGKSQLAYGVYKSFNHTEYMELVSQGAESERRKLEKLGVSKEYFEAGVDLTKHYKDSPLSACLYNPLKDDFSKMPEESTLRFVITFSMTNGFYREFAKVKYDEIEAAVHKAAKQREEMQNTLDEYNRTVSKEDILKMQENLKEMNIYQGEITGEYNQEFLIAVAGYQHIGNTVSSKAAVQRDIWGDEGYNFTVDGKITDKLINLSNRERETGYYNNPNVKIGFAVPVAIMVGVGDGIVSQLIDEGSDIVKTVWSVTPINPKYWTETLPESYKLGVAIANGDITFDDIKESLGEGLAEEYIVPFETIKQLSDKVFSGKATYEESVRYGRALTKATEAVLIVVSAAKAGAQLGSKVSKKVSEMIPRLHDKIKPYINPSIRMVTPEGIPIQFIDSGPSDAPNAGGTVSGGTPKVILDGNYLKHATLGDFTYNPRTGALQKMKGGGHGQDNIDFLETNGIEYNIEKTYTNGVRVGNVPSHKEKLKKTGTGQSWFPENWTVDEIQKAGEYVANLKNARVGQHGAKYSIYKNVEVGVYIESGKVTTVFPNGTQTHLIGE